MDLFDYDRTQPQQFGGVLPDAAHGADPKAVILPVPFDRTTSYGQGTKHGPRELLLASAQVELWDEEVGVDVHPHGMFTAPELDLSAHDAGRRDGGDRARHRTTCSTPASFSSRLAASTRSRRRSSKRSPRGIRACRCCRSTRTPTCATAISSEPHSHACAMRRTLAHAPLVQVGIRNMSEEEAKALPGLRDDDLL